AVMLRIPPLRNRREDIPFLIETMLEEFVHKHHIGQMPELAPEATQMLINHAWRGNIRELRNTLEQLVVLVCSVQRTSDRCIIGARDVERALASSISGWDGQDFERSLPAPAAHRENPQTERELIYRALIELRAEMADIKELLEQRGWDSSHRTTNLPALPPSTNGAQENAIKSLDELETNAIERALEYYHGNRRHAAKALGISERSLYRKLKEKGME
ncbi:MAG TPA: helix-turn-helix domain-containing protein, partial [Candidatus Kapabacteria bacterium]|nr:helix-turn-helix domain-containing protein [Candidatus Kapabacteria bacterium]